MHVAQLISDIIHYLQGSRPQDTQWTRRSPTRPWGFQLWLWASVSPTWCPSPPARSRHHDIGKYAHRSTDFLCHLLFAGIAPARHLVDPEKSNRVLGFPALITRLGQFYRVPIAPNKVIRPPINRDFIKKYCAPQAGAGRDTTSTWGWPAAGNRRIAATSRAPQLIYKGWSIAYDPWLTNRRPSPKPKVSKSTRSMTDKSSGVQLKTLKKHY